MGAYLFEPLSDPIAGLFAIIISLFFITAAISSLWKKEGFTAFDRYAPSGLTAIGVIGTFLGIFVGLIEFDVTDIDASIPSLLSGLKIAFITSIMGMITSVLLNFTQTMKKQDVGTEDVSGKDILKVMTEIRDETTLSRDHMASLLKDLKNAISGEGESTLITQIQKLRTSSHDDTQELKKATTLGFDSMKDEFKFFAEKMADNNSKALIEALQEVIRDFNAKINEQFGENFKQLNKAVGGLLTWQENYKTHVESLVADFDEVRSGISETRDAIALISEHSKAIPKTMEEFRKAIHLADDQIGLLQSHLEAVAGLRDKALNAFPVIEDNIEKLTTGFSSHVTESVNLVAATLSDQTDTIKDITDQNILLLQETTARHQEAATNLDAATMEIPKQVKHVLGQLNTGIDEAVSSYGKAMESSIHTQSEALQEISAGLRDSLQKSLSDTNGLIKESFTEFDDQMQSEIERAIGTMGSHLATLSNKFVEDYTPLTEKLHHLVEMSRRVGD